MADASLAPTAPPRNIAIRRTPLERIEYAVIVSTLLLLVAAAIGNDWKKMYDYALENGFRFLSYGDANLLFLPQ